MKKSLLDGLDPEVRRLVAERDARAVREFAAYRAAYTPTPITDERVECAAPALVLQLWRNTDAVETKLHAGKGVFSDVDMLRKNTWATKLTIDMLRELADLEKRGELTQETVRGGFTRLQGEFADLIPATAKGVRAGYVDETAHMFAGMATACTEWGLEFWLHAMGIVSERELWWASPRWAKAVDILLTFPDQPDPKSLEDRLRECPWELTDDQAYWLMRWIYKVPARLSESAVEG